MLVRVTLPDGRHKQKPRAVVVVTQHGDPHFVEMFVHHLAYSLAFTNGTRQHECCHLYYCTPYTILSNNHKLCF